MVLQRAAPVPVWGWASPGEQIMVAIGKQRLNTVADAKGEWEVRLKPMRAGGPFEMVVIGTNSVTLKNVMVGEVWVCSGQSNMQMAVSQCNNAQEELKNSNNSKIRLFGVQLKVADQPQRNTEGAW